MARKKAAKKKAAKKAAKKAPRKAAKKAPARTSARGAQPKTKMSGRTKTERGTNRGQKQQPAARSAKQAPQRKAGAKAAASPRGAGASARKGRAETAPRAPTQKTSAATGRPRKQNRPERAEGDRKQADRKRGEKTQSTRGQRWDESDDREMQTKASGRARRRRDSDTGLGSREPTERELRGGREDEGKGPQRQQESQRSSEDRGDSKRRRGPTGARREIQSGIHAESEGIQQAQGRWQNEEHMTPAPQRHRQQRSENTDSGGQMGQSREAPLPDGHDRGADDLDHARRHTTIRDESEDEGYGRSEGAENRRMSQMGEYGADDDEQHFGRNLGGRNRIPGGGSRRNR
jgi:hypothetical protein